MANENLLSDRYNPAEVEAKIYKIWEAQELFKAEERSNKIPFSIILPPPNVTGFLHMGHALDHSMQDLMVRYKRMSGFNVLWLPGTDHAGIATQTVVEKDLKKNGLPGRVELGRDAFLEKVWTWKDQYGNRIYDQMKRLGDSCDWSRAQFTLDEGVSKAVKKVFVSLYKKGLIYRGERLVNWSGPLETAISDIEVEHKQIKGTLFHIEYKSQGGESLVVATTRPETLFGDTALAVNPQDDRYKHLIGQFALVPICNRRVPIIGDSYVEKEFGTGVLKVTPAHDFNDYQVGQRHKLPLINILDKRCQLNDQVPEAFCGLKVQEARKRVIQTLKDQGALVKEEPYVHSVGHCSRSGAVVEPFLSEQWFVKMKELSIPAKRVVESGTISFEPESWTKTYLHWMDIIEDWCISRQLWWGHRIPAWHCSHCQHITVSEDVVSACENCGKTDGLKQDEDVLDTWFSSALWPFSTMGWPQNTELLKTFYPTSVLVTGHDIIFFWVARMIMMGLHFCKDVPFRKVLIHGLVRDASGQKMSKSLGNSLDPVEMIDKYGADALRFTLLSQVASGKDLKFSEQRLEGYRNFMNKIWNATRFALAQIGDQNIQSELTQIKPEDLGIYNQWIIYKTQVVAEKVEKSLEALRFSDAAQALYHFIWHEFCDWYIEFTKPILNRNTNLEASTDDNQNSDGNYNPDSSNIKLRELTTLVLVESLNKIMRLLHPFCPFITEELFQKLPAAQGFCAVATYPTLLSEKAWFALGSREAAETLDFIKEVIDAVRNFRGENRISPAVQISIRVQSQDPKAHHLLDTHKATLMSLARLSSVEISDQDGLLTKCAVTPVVTSQFSAKVIIPLEGLLDIKEEVLRIKKLIEKLEKEVLQISQRLNNENFIKNASPEVVEQDKLIKEQGEVRLKSLRESLLRLDA